RKELLQKLEPLEDVEKELKEYEKLKPQGSEEEAKQFEIQNENQKNREFEKQFYTDAVNNVRSLLFKLQTFKSDIEASIVQLGSFETPLNKEILGSFKGLLNPTFTEIEGEVNKLTKKLSEASDLAKKQIGELESVHRDQETNFTQLKQRFEKNREYFQRLNQLTKRVTAKTVSKKELDVVAEKLTSAVDQRKELLTSLKGVYRRIYETRLGKVIDINLELDGDVKIILKEGGIVKEYERALKEALKGKGFNYNEICSKIVTSLAPVDFSTYVLKEDSKSLSVLLGIGIDKAKVIIDSLLATQDIFALETIYCPDLPTFFLKVDRKDDAENQDKDNYRQTENLSTGQRCTAILPIIFAASSNPLVIDQPEDNLDNKYIADTIHKIIKRKKDFRQLIFVTHNPNIPVLSDAEFNVFLDYKGKKTKVDKSGTIDEVKINILTLLEGGEDAFKKRSEIYGY
ncbi:MAG: hypothetical protein ACXVLQ_14435, partial [Bacteriovorax sp.]